MRTLSISASMNVAHGRCHRDKIDRHRLDIRISRKTYFLVGNMSNALGFTIDGS